MNHSPTDSKPEWAHLVRFCVAGLTIATALTALAGWIFGVQVLKALVPVSLPMKANTALTFMVAALALLLQRKPDPWNRPSGRANAVLTLLSSFVLLMGAVSLVEYITRRDFGIDQLFFLDVSRGSWRPGLMSPLTAIAFVLIGTALLSIQRKPVLQQVLSVACFLCGLFGLLDYLFDPETTHLGIALNTSLLLMIFPVGVLAARPDGGIVALIRGDTMGGKLVRWMLPVAIVLRPLIGWLEWHGIQRGLISNWFGVAITALIFAAVLMAFVLIVGWQLDVADEQRASALRGLREAHSRMVGIVSGSTDPIAAMDRSGKYIVFNDAYRQFFRAIHGSDPSVGRTLQELLTTNDAAARRALSLWDRALNGKDLPITESLEVGPDKRWFELRFSPIEYDGGFNGVVEIGRDVTQLKGIEEALQAEQQKLTTVLDVLPAYVVLLSPDYHVPFANRYFRDHFGESHGRRCYEYLFGRSEPCEICETYKVLKTNAPLQWEWKGPDGRDYDVFDVPFQNTDGTTMILEMGLDMTERKRAEEAVRKASLYARSLLEASLDPLVTISRDGRITDVNRSAELVTGVSRDQLIGSDFSDYFTNPQKAREGYQQVFAEGSVRDYPLAVLHTSGHITDVLYNATVFRNQAGEIEGVFAAARDITDRKRAEEELHESETKFRTLSELVPQFVWMCRPDGLNVYFNQRWVEYTGLSLEESYGRGWNTPFHPQDKQHAWEAWNHAVTTGETYRVESRLRAADGSYRWFLMRGVPLRDAAGKVERWFGTCTDIDDLKRAEEQVALRAQELARSNTELEQFAYIASHDLQEPLRMVASYTQLLASRYRTHLDATADKYIDYAVEGAQRMRALINDLLALSRVTTRGVPSGPVDLNQVVREVCGMLVATIRETNARVESEDLPIVMADATQMHQLLQNLIGNALKFHGDQAPLVRIRGARNDREWTIAVEDNGIGIDPQYSDRIFVAFQRLHTRAEYPGNGIGLAICKKIVERHGGRIWVESIPGHGSKFIFALPVGHVTDIPKEVDEPAVMAEA